MKWWCDSGQGKLAVTTSLHILVGQEGPDPSVLCWLDFCSQVYRTLLLFTLEKGSKDLEVKV